MIVKLGEAQEIKIEDTMSCVSEVSPDVLESFQKFATNLKKIAPKANDFLYFSAVMMHAAESSAINEDGTPKLNSKGEVVKVGWDTSGNTWKWQTNDPLIRPFKNCFVPGTEILMDDGSSKKIEDIVVGDMVISHTGKAQKVLRKFITPHNGSVFRLKIKNNQDIICTDNHPFYHADLSFLKSKEKSLGKLTERKRNNPKFATTFKFSKTSDLTFGDLLLSPVIHTKVESNLNANRARLLGIWAAEGSFSKKYSKRQAVHFTVGITETKQVELIKSIFEEEFPECSVNINPEPSRSIIGISASGHNIAEYFFYHCGEYSHEKKLSKQLVFASDEIKKSFLAGWLDGDGCLTDKNKLVGITVSPHLAHQIRVMLNSMKVGNSLRKVYNGKRVMKNLDGNGKEYPRKDNYRIEIYGEGYKKIDLDKLTVKYAFGESSTRTPANFEDDYCLHLLKKKSEETYVGDVFNFEVEEDHSYVANGVVVHNCNGDVFPESQLILAYKKWRQKPLCIDHKSSSVDHTRGFIVDTYYDRNLKRVIALCALDKANYPDLARKVATGMQSAVSMGCGVGRAICTETGCHRVARSEADFCTHMKNKTGYGEINIDLNPIELSIVVNGADPKAHIKNILASANTLNAYVDSKMTKLADFTANLNFVVGQDSQTDGSQTTSVQVNSKDIESFRKDVEKAIQDFQQLQSSLTNEDASPGNNEASNQSGSSVAMDEGAPTDSGMSLQSPQNARLASVGSEQNEVAQSLEELHSLTATIETKLNQMKHSLNKLAITQTQEENMSTANKDLNKQGYFQGGGGVNEPTPGQVKYSKDPLNEHLRDKEDKQMVGQSPFPEVGPVDGMHPSPASVDPSDELARKKMLARAEAEERAMKRNAIVASAQKALADRQALIAEGYFNGGGGVNEPTPGKPKYPKDPLAEKDRDHEDKQMNGKSPFPGVGKVDDMYPGDEKTKEMVGRASLRARFVKAANSDGQLNKSKSAWEVFLGDKLLLTASVNELSSGNVDLMYDGIATKDFGVKLIAQVNKKGAQTVSQNIKRAQATPPAPDSSAPPAPDAETPPAPDAVPPVEDEGKSGDPKKHALELSEKVRDLSSDLVEAVRALTGEQAEMGEMSPGDVGGAGGVGSPAGGPAMADDKTSTASFGTSVLNNWRKDLNGVLTSALKESIAELDDHGRELDMIVGMYDKGAVNDANRETINTIVEDALTEAKTSIADGFKLMTAFVKYARGTQVIVKRAEQDMELQALAGEGDDMDSKKDSQSADGLMDLVNDTNADLDAVKMMVDDNAHSDLEETGKEDDGLDALLEGMADDNMAETLVKTKDQGVQALKNNPDPKAEVTVMASVDSRAGRAALRAKIAADATGKEDDGEVQDASKIKFSDMLQEANKLSDGNIQLDTKPSDNLGRVETLPEINKRMLEVAKMSPKVRKEAEAIQKLVSEGKLHPDHVEALIKEGLDKDAVAYWKHFYGEVDGGSEFASELVKEHTKAEVAEELNKFQIKMARAYELAYDMAERGLCHTDRTAVSAQVDEIMKFSDENFDSLKRVVARHKPLNKTAGSIPQVGFRDDEIPSTKAVMAVDDYTQLSGMLGVKKSMF